MGNSAVHFERISADIVRLTLCRPERSNAFSTELLEEFSERLDEIRLDSRCRAVVLAAEGRNFCGGLDLLEASRSEENARKMAAMVVELLVQLRRIPSIVLAAVHGAARAGGAALIAASDLVVASDDFHLAFPEVRRGLEPILLFPLLRRRLSISALNELLLTGEPIDAVRAQQFGLVHRIVPVGSELEAAIEWAGNLRDADRRAIRTTKELILVQETMTAGCSLEEEFSRSLENHLASWRSRSGREGVAAFLEKRAAQFE